MLIVILPETANLSIASSVNLYRHHQVDLCTTFAVNLSSTGPIPPVPACPDDI